MNGEIRQRYKVTDFCGHEFYCVISCLPTSTVAMTQEQYPNKPNITLSISAQLCRYLSYARKILLMEIIFDCLVSKLHVTRTENRIDITMDNETSSMRSETEVITESYTTVPISENTSSESKLTSIVTSSLTTPRMPCPCAIPRTTPAHFPTTTTQTTTTTTSTTPKAPMPCPCVPISHTTPQSKASETEEETTDEIKIKTSSVYETPETPAAIEQTTTISSLDIQYNCTTDTNADI